MKNEKVIMKLAHKKKLGRQRVKSKEKKNRKCQSLYSECGKHVLSRQFFQKSKTNSKGRPPFFREQYVLGTKIIKSETDLK